LRGEIEVSKYQLGRDENLSPFPSCIKQVRVVSIQYEFYLEILCVMSGLGSPSCFPFPLGPPSSRGLTACISSSIPTYLRLIIIFPFHPDSCHYHYLFPLSDVCIRQILPSSFPLLPVPPSSPPQFPDFVPFLLPSYYS